MEKDKLLRKIYLTRKARIILSEELKSKHKFYQNLIIYYTVVIIIYSILGITNNFSNSAYILIMSITLSFFTVAVQSQKHLERYLSLKQHYIKLDDLYQKLLIEDNLDKIVEIRIKYIEMLDTVENHQDIHHIKYCKQDEVEWKARSSHIKDTLRIVFYDSKCLLEKVILIAIPIVIPLVLDLVNKYLN